MADILLIHGDGGIRTRGGALLGRSHEQNPLNEDSAAQEGLLRDGGPLLVISSGRLGAPHRTWGPQGAAAFHDWCVRLRLWKQEGAGEGRRVMVRPHHADVLSDIQRCVSFDRGERGGLEIAMDPAGLLAPSMIERAEDHLRRFLEAVDQCAGMGAVVLTNLKVGADGSVEPSPVHTGALSPELLRPYAALAAARGVPLLLRDEETTAQLRLVDSWGV